MGSPVHGRYFGQQYKKQPSLADSRAQAVGFRDAAHQQSNRILRNQIQQKAAAAGISNQAAFNMATGDLTSNAVLQDIWNRLPSAPVGGGGGGGGGSSAASQYAALSAASQKYRQDAEAAIEAGRLRIQQLEDEELQRQKAAELQNRLAIQAAASKARGEAAAALKIAPASETSRTAGTQSFKRRQPRLSKIQSTAGINVPETSVLNV